MKLSHLLAFDLLLNKVLISPNYLSYVLKMNSQQEINSRKILEDLNFKNKQLQKGINLVSSPLVSAIFILYVFVLF